MKSIGAPRVTHRAGRYVASAVRHRGQLCTVVNPQGSTYRSGKVVQTNRATSLNPQHPAHTLQAKLALMFGHECVLHPDSLAKYVAAFFKISRSSLALLSSALSRDTSALSEAFSPLPTPCCC
jgi:hypothetical protein